MNENLECMKAITVEDVLKAVEELSKSFKYNKNITNCSENV